MWDAQRQLREAAGLGGSGREDTARQGHGSVGRGCGGRVLVKELGVCSQGSGNGCTSQPLARTDLISAGPIAGCFPFCITAGRCPPFAVLRHWDISQAATRLLS